MRRRIAVPVSCAAALLAATVSIPSTDAATRAGRGAVPAHTVSTSHSVPHAVPATARAVVHPGRLVTPQRTETAAASVRALRKFNGIRPAMTPCTCDRGNGMVAVGPTVIVEIAGGVLAIYSRTSGLQRVIPVQTILGGRAGSYMRLLYDPTWKRIVLVSESAGGFVLGMTEDADPYGPWSWAFVRETVPSGGTVVFPMLGMDADALIVTTRILGPVSDPPTNPTGAVVALPKSLVYNGFGVTVPQFTVADLTAPAIVAGRPTATTGTTYLICADDAADQLHVYAMTNTSRPDSTTLTESDISFPIDSPPADIAQPGTTDTMHVQTSSIISPPSQSGTRLWFTHDIGQSGYATVQWGYVDTSAMSADTALAYASNTSSDFVPSLVALSTPTGPVEVLNWATLDNVAGTNTRDVYRVVRGDPVDLITSKAYSPVGSYTTGEPGEYSNVAADYWWDDPCAAGASAVMVNEYFASDHSWRTRIGIVGRC